MDHQVRSIRAPPAPRNRTETGLELPERPKAVIRAFCSIEHLWARTGPSPQSSIRQNSSVSVTGGNDRIWMYVLARRPPYLANAKSRVSFSLVCEPIEGGVGWITYAFDCVWPAGRNLDHRQGHGRGAVQRHLQGVIPGRAGQGAWALLSIQYSTMTVRPPIAKQR